jgi:hypothetical protein
MDGWRDIAKLKDSLLRSFYKCAINRQWYCCSLQTVDKELTCWVTDITVSVRTSPPDLIRSTTCLCVAPSTVTPFLKENKQHTSINVMNWKVNLEILGGRILGFKYFV